MADDSELTHLALWVSDLDASLAFYRDYAALTVAAERTEPSGMRVAWLSDAHKRMVLVLLAPRRMPLRKRIGIAIARRFSPPSHIGVECPSRRAVEERCERARRAGVLRKPAADRGGEAGFMGIIADPDGNDLEVSYGQATRSVLEEPSR